MRWLALCLSGVLALATVSGSPIGAYAQDGAQTAVPRSQVVVIDTDRLVKESKPGQAMLSELQQQRDTLIARNREIEARLQAEEKSLTRKREATPPEAFRKMADAFDAKVQRIRKERDQAGRDLEHQAETLPVRFLRMVQPVLGGVLKDAGAGVMIERRSVLMSLDAVNVTDAAIARIDAAYDAGTLPPPPVPDVSASGANDRSGGADQPAPDGKPPKVDVPDTPVLKVPSGQ